jgi:hypothetical protein
MADEKTVATDVLSTEKSHVRKTDAPASISAEVLLQMLLDSQKQNAESNKLLAEAIMESRKPYVDPKVLEQKRLALEERQAQIRQEARNRAAKKTQCPHIRDNGTSSINWMEHSNSITKGVCSNCFSEFDARITADRALLIQNPKALQKMGRAGQHANTRVIGQ